MSKPLEGKIALVTGASRGIGYAAAKAYAEAGAHVIAVARAKSIGALEELDDEILQATGSNATIVPLDLMDGASIDRLGGAIFERWGKLDILLANAGLLGPISPLGHVDPKEWDKVMSVNLTAPFRLIRSMDPLLKLSETPRAIFVTSAAAGKNRPFWGPYAVSKAALEELAFTYANESKVAGIKVNLVDPGPIRTGMRAQAMPGEDPMTLPTPDQMTGLFLELAAPTLEKTGECIRFYDWAGIERA